MNENRVVNRLFWTIAAAVILIALGSFVWSFLSLWSLAEANSTQTGLGWIWPLIVDTSMVIYTGAILVAQLQRRGAKLPIGLTIFYAGVTITGNVLHAPQTPLGWFVAVLPPLSLIFGTEMLRAMGHHIIERQAVVSTLAELSAIADTRRADLDRIGGHIEQATAKLAGLKSDILREKAASVQQLNAARQAKIDTRRASVLSLVQEGFSPVDISQRLDVTVRTVKRDIGALNGKVRAQ